MNHARTMTPDGVRVVCGLSFAEAGRYLVHVDRSRRSLGECWACRAMVDAFGVDPPSAFRVISRGELLCSSPSSTAVSQGLRVQMLGPSRRSWVAR